MAKIPQISLISNLHGEARSEAARVVELAIAIKTLIKAITPKTITIR
jgi:hypothetical protein